MKKFMKKVTILFVLMFCFTALTACGSKKKSVDQTVVHGTWVKTGNGLITTYVIKSDGTFTEEAVATGEFPVTVTDSGTYTYDGTKIVFKSHNWEVETEYKVSFDGADMIWTYESSGKQMRYIKQ